MTIKEPSAYGFHACMAMLKNSKRQIERLWVRKTDVKRYPDIIDAAEQRHILIEYVSADRFAQSFADKVHQGLALWAKALPVLAEADLANFIEKLTAPAFILILDGVTDPHNLGACLRTADAAGVDLVIVPKDKSADLNPTVAKVSSGASESVPFLRVTNLARCIQNLQSLGIWVYGAAGETECSLYQLDGQAAIALVLGAEGDGLRRLTREVCDGLYAIPMLGQVSSLNVSVAAAVSMYEIRRQRT